MTLVCRISRHAQCGQFVAGDLDRPYRRRHGARASRLGGPEEANDYDYSSFDRAALKKHRDLQFVGSPKTVRSQLDAFVDKTGADEWMVATFVHSHEDRIRSFELLADAFE